MGLWHSDLGKRPDVKEQMDKLNWNVGWRGGIREFVGEQIVIDISMLIKSRDWEDALAMCAKLTSDFIFRAEQLKRPQICTFARKTCFMLCELHEARFLCYHVSKRGKTQQ